MKPRHRAETLTQYFDLIWDLAKRWKRLRDDDLDLWFRGLHKSNWPLVPSLYRYLDEHIAVYEAEDEIRENFIRRAQTLTEERPSNVWEWYFTMQHHGAPTRLLDWTDSSQLALYFAVKNDEGLHDAAVWVLDPFWLNSRVLRKNEVIPPGSLGLTEADTRRYRPWLPDRFDAKKRLRRRWPIAVASNHFSRRIAAQHSCFTIHGLQRRGLEELFRGSKDHLAKITIPSYRVKELRHQLEDVGIDEVSIYPDLQGLGSAVSRGFWRRDDASDPHTQLFTRLGPSNIHGVGVFAIKKIKRGTRLFSEDIDEMLWVERDRLPKQRALRKFYDDFAVHKNDRYGCPKHFHRLTMSWYLNDPKEGEKPNVCCDENYEFKALRDIKPREELTVDSTAYSDHAKNFSARRRSLR